MKIIKLLKLIKLLKQTKLLSKVGPALAGRAHAWLRARCGWVRAQVGRRWFGRLLVSQVGWLQGWVRV